MIADCSTLAPQVTVPATHVESYSSIFVYVCGGTPNLYTVLFILPNFQIALCSYQTFSVNTVYLNVPCLISLKSNLGILHVNTGMDVDIPIHRYF